jgi:hypothetical protein
VAGAKAGEFVVFLRPIGTAGPWHEAQSRAVLPRQPAEHPALAHLICAVRLLLLVPLVLCAGVAWLAASVVVAVWVVAMLPFRGHGASGPN